MLDRPSAEAEGCANSVESLWAERCRQQQTLFDPPVVSRDVEFSASLDTIQQPSYGFRPEDTIQLVELVVLVAVLATTMLSLIILWTFIRNWVTSRYPKSHPPRRITALNAFQRGQAARNIVDVFDDLNYDADDSDSNSAAEILFAVIESSDLQCGVIFGIRSIETIVIEKYPEISIGSQATGDEFSSPRNSFCAGIDPAKPQFGIVFDITTDDPVGNEKNPECAVGSQDADDVLGFDVNTFFTVIDPLGPQCGAVLAIPPDETIEIQKNPEKYAESQDMISTGIDPVDPQCEIAAATTSTDEISEIEKDTENTVLSEEIHSGIRQNAEESRPESTRAAVGRQKDEENSAITTEGSFRNSESDLMDVSTHCDVDPDEFNQEEATVSSGIHSTAALSQSEMSLSSPTPCQGQTNSSSGSPFGCLPDVFSDYFAHLYENAIVVEDIPHLDSVVVHTVVVLQFNLNVTDAKDAESDGSFHSVSSSCCDWFTASSDDDDDNEVISNSYVGERHRRM